MNHHEYDNGGSMPVNGIAHADYNQSLPMDVVNDNKDNNGGGLNQSVDNIDYDNNNVNGGSLPNHTVEDSGMGMNDYNFAVGNAHPPLSVWRKIGEPKLRSHSKFLPKVIVPPMHDSPSVGALLLDHVQPPSAPGTSPQGPQSK